MHVIIVRDRFLYRTRLENEFHEKSLNKKNKNKLEATFHFKLNTIRWSHRQGEV